MSAPTDLLYSDDHEWVRTEADGTLVVGITAFAADALGDVVHVELPAVGAAVTAGQSCGEVESTKSVSDLVAPATGTVTAVNEALAGDPDPVSADPYGGGWLYRLQGEVAEGLLDPAAYDALVAGS